MTLCLGCGQPLTGVRRDAKYHGGECRKLAREQTEPLRRFYAAFSEVPRFGADDPLRPS